MAFSFIDPGRRLPVDVRFTWIVVDRISRCIRMLFGIKGRKGPAAVVVISGEEGRGEEPLSVNNVDNGGRCGNDHTRRALAGDRRM
jgi:hypothetical protein